MGSPIPASLPIPDVDHLPLGSVADRIRSPERGELERQVTWGG